MLPTYTKLTLVDYPVGSVLTTIGGQAVQLLEHGKAATRAPFVKVLRWDAGDTCLYNANGSWLSWGGEDQLERVLSGQHKNLWLSFDPAKKWGIDPSHPSNRAVLALLRMPTAEERADPNPLYW